MAKLGRNALCPCGSGEKFKRSCLGRVPWPEFLETNNSRGVLHMEARGKNLCFLATIAGVLQLDKLPSDHKWRDIKRAVTPDAVKALHEAVAYYWPSGE